MGQVFHFIYLFSRIHSACLSAFHILVPRILVLLPWTYPSLALRPAWLWDPPTSASARRAPRETHPPTMTTGLRDSGQAPLSSVTHMLWSFSPFPPSLPFSEFLCVRALWHFINVLSASCNHTRSHTAWSRNHVIHVWVSTPTPVPRMTNFHTWTLNDDTTDHWKHRWFQETRIRLSKNHPLAQLFEWRTVKCLPFWEDLYFLRYSQELPGS